MVASAAPIEMPPLRSLLAAVTQQGWAATSVPLAPSQVTRHYSQVVADALDTAASLGVAVPVEVWTPDGEAVDADAHATRLHALVHADAPPPVTLATDPGQLDRMVEVAGEVVAWGG